MADPICTFTVSYLSRLLKHKSHIRCKPVKHELMQFNTIDRRLDHRYAVNIVGNDDNLEVAMTTMKAVVLHGVNDLRVEDLPVPEPGAGEVRVKITKCGVCGTDVHMWAGTNLEGEFPFVPGQSGLASWTSQVPKSRA